MGRIHKMSLSLVISGTFPKDQPTLSKVWGRHRVSVAELTGVGLEDDNEYLLVFDDG